MAGKEKQKHKILIVGNGSWATAIYKMLVVNGLKPYWWVRQQETKEFILYYKHNPRYLSQVEIDIKPHHIDNDLKKSLRRKDMVILATPSKYLYSALEKLKARDFADKLVISAIKGIVNETGETPLEFLASRFNIEPTRTVSISGPCHAEEVAAEKTSYLTFSSTSQYNAVKVSRLFENRFIKTNISSDVHGTEYAAILKNIYAILAGICHGQGYGDNFQAVLVSSALGEMKHFLSKIYPQERDVTDTCYSGDLFVTAYSQYSRNRTLGTMIGKGYSIKTALLEMQMVAEGFDASKAVYNVSREHKLNTPLIDAVYRILHENISPKIEISLLTNFLNQRNY